MSTIIDKHNDENDEMLKIRNVLLDGWNIGSLAPESANSALTKAFFSPPKKRWTKEQHLKAVEILEMIENKELELNIHKENLENLSFTNELLMHFHSEIVNCKAEISRLYEKYDKL
jgi:hypothetical protein